MKKIDCIDKQCNWFIEYSETQKCMHIESEFDERSRPNPEWQLVETFFGTMKQANDKANKYLKNATKSQQK